MKKSMLTPAIIICSMMMIAPNANAAFWLDIVKEFVVGGIKTIVMPQKIKNPLAEPTPTKITVEAPKSGADSTAQGIWDALRKLENVCMEIGTKVPCSIGEGRALSTGMARDKALAKARIEIANTMGAYVENNVELGASSDEEDGVFKEVQNYIQSGKIKTQQLVTGSQQYMSYTYIDEEDTKKNNGKSVYVTTVVMVMNKDLFKQALEDVSKEKPLGEQLIKESKKGIVAIVKNAIKKI